MPRRLLILAVSCLALLAVPAVAQAKELRGVVGPGFNISLTDESGAPVTNIDPGTYTLVVRDNSDIHNFHLRGDNVDVATEIEFVGTMTFTITVTNGVYNYVCDAHSGSMRGSFGAGSAPPPPPPPTKIYADVGPGATISLRRRSGARIKSLAEGRYKIVVRDRSSKHNFHLVGMGVNRKTGVKFKGTVSWTVTLHPSTYRFRCDAHARTMKGSFRVR